MEVFDINLVKRAKVERTPSYCCLVRSARITPSTVYYNVPSVDISNCVIRRYANLADNFLRVRFTDAKHIGRIHATVDNTMDEVLTRIKRALANGITIGSTRYEFLAFGNSSSVSMERTSLLQRTASLMLKYAPGRGSSVI
jgi:RNA-dependent RNA polymerase